MDERQEFLLKAVKTAVEKYGLSGVTTRNVAEIAQVNDAYIYHFFKDKEDLLLQAYCYENGRIFQSILYAIDKVSPLSQSFREKARMCFQQIWKTMLSDPERLTFCVFIITLHTSKMQKNTTTGSWKNCISAWVKFSQARKSVRRPCMQYARCCMIRHMRWSVGRKRIQRNMRSGYLRWNRLCLGHKFKGWYFISDFLFAH